MIISKTKLKARLHRKTNPVVVESLKSATPSKVWNSLAKKISGPRRKYASVNLGQIDKKSKEGDIVIIVGKVLAGGSLTKKVRICAFSISDAAREKLKSTKSEFALIEDEIKKNPKAEGVSFL